MRKQSRCPSRAGDCPNPRIEAVNSAAVKRAMIFASTAAAALTGPRTPLAPRMMADPSRTFGRCEPWASERATARQIVGVVGRFTDSASWRDRSSFATVDASADTPLQAETENRYAVAKKLGQVERVAFLQNVPKLRFDDERLAASVGATADDFASIDEATMQIVFDALAQSKTSLVKQDDADARIAAWRGADGGFDADAFGAGLRQGAGAVIAANAVLYFFLISGAFIVFKIAVGIAT